MNILSEIRSRFEVALAKYCDNPVSYLSMVKPSSNPQFGDFQANFAMSLAGKQSEKINPRDLAARIAEEVNLSDICNLPQVAGPGFINLTLRDDWLISITNSLVSDDRLGVKVTSHPCNIVVDYSAPNVAKPMHVGHLRSSVIGDALYHILSFLGHQVTGDNHIGDWGTQFGMIIFGYKHFLDKAAFEENNVNELSRLYKLVNQLSDYHKQKAAIPQRAQVLDMKRDELALLEESPDAEKKGTRKKIGKLKAEIGDLKKELQSTEEKIVEINNDSFLKPLVDAHPHIAKEARLETSKLHAGDTENLKLWNQFLPPCLDAINAMYAKLGITFDMALGESFYQPMLENVVNDLTSKRLATKSEGATCVFQEGNKAPFIVRKSDGAFTYATTDLATIQYRVDELQAKRILYVVDARQGEHFQLLFDTAVRWGYSNTEYRHVSFGTILGDDKRPFKTRSGDTVGLESLLNESITRARKIIDENDDAKLNGAELDDTRRAEIAEIVGIGGIKYADLHHNR
ncbi:Arginyl-tRNA synthetase, partial [hydrothermal vent metagenome]